MIQSQHLTGIVNHSPLGQRLDRALTQLFPNYSRSLMKSWILNGQVMVNGALKVKPKHKMFGGESIEINLPIREEIFWEAQDITLDIVYEDADIIVINKSKDMVVHPAPGNADGTILNALLHYYPPIIHVPRVGIVHRLDKDTTGLMVVAKTITAQARLVNSLQEKKIIREYEAIAIGNITMNGTVEQPIARHSYKWTYMTVHPMGKPAITHYRIIENFREHTHLRLRLETGRTHQIRVHMAYINHPLVGDPRYNRRRGGISKNRATETLKKILLCFNRQALHATMVQLFHPITSVKMRWYAPLPQDMVELLDALRRNDADEFDRNRDGISGNV